MQNILFQSGGPIDYEFDWDDKMVYLKYHKDFVIDQHSCCATRADNNSKKYFDYFDKYLKTTFLKNKKNPYIIIDCEGFFTNLDNIQFKKSLINTCNIQGLDIYLWEIPIIGLQKDPGIKFTNEADVIYNINAADSVLHGFQEGNPVCYEFEKIQQFVTRNKLKNVTVNTGLYNQHQYFDHYSFKLKTQDIYLSCTVTPDKDTVIKTFSYNRDITIPESKQIQHKFINLNKRYEGFRQVVAAHMLDKDCILSYIHKHTDLYIKENNNTKMLKNTDRYWKSINNRVSFDCAELFKDFNNLESNMHTLETKQIFAVDRNTNDTNWMKLTNDEEYDVPTAHYYQAFCAVVNESTFAFPVAHFADKTINAIKCYRPFVLVAPPHTLEYMHQLGFKTFNDWWNEDYDKEETHLQRLKSVLQLINSIDSMSIKQCRHMYEQMIPTLKHNYALLGDIRQQKGI